MTLVVFDVFCLLLFLCCSSFVDHRLLFVAWLLAVVDGVIVLLFGFVFVVGVIHCIVACLHVCVVCCVLFVACCCALFVCDSWLFVVYIPWLLFGVFSSSLVVGCCLLFVVFLFRCLHLLFVC